MTSNRCVCIIAWVCACALLAGAAGCPQPDDVRPAVTAQPPARAVALTGPAPSALDNLDDGAVASDLRDLGMVELLGALARQDANSPVLDRRAVAADVILDQAGGLADQMAANSLVDKALRILDGLIAATKGAKTPLGQVHHLKFRLTRAVAEGLGHIQLRVQRLQYLVDGPADRVRIVGYADAALNDLEGIQTDIDALLAKWRAIPEIHPGRELWELEELNRECHFRRAWLLFYSAAATPKTAGNKPRRDEMLAEAIDLAKQFLASGESKDPGKVIYLLLAGMACREIGRFDGARGYFRRMAELGCPNDRLRAAFEIARTALESGGKLEDALNAIKGFQNVAGAVEGVRPVAIAMQTVLLKSRLYESLAEALKTSDPIKSKNMSALSIQEIAGFIKVYPAYTQAFMDVVGAGYEGRNLDDLPPQFAAALRSWRQAKGN
jgi:tetratricopeptide (TPR) repeat protein